MSARRKELGSINALAVPMLFGLLVWTPSIAAFAQGTDTPAQRTLLRSVSAALGDPFRVRPPVLQSGSTLPGDLSPLVCQKAILPEHMLSLADAVDAALCSNPQIRGAWADIKVQSAALGEAKAAYLPSVVAGISRTVDRTAYPGSGLPESDLDGSLVNVGLTWRLFDFGARAASQRVASALLESALASHDSVLQKTLSAVIGAYFDAQTARAMVDGKMRSEALSRRTLESAQRRESQGAGAQSDTLQATTALAKATLERSRAQGEFSKSLAMLIYFMGVPPNSRLGLADDLADDSPDVGQDLDDWLDAAQREHPAIVAARAQLGAAREKVKATQAEGLPSIDLTGNYYQNGRPNQGLSPARTSEKVIALTLNIPLFEGFARTYKVSGARAQVEQKEAELEDTSHQVQLEVAKAHGEALSALGNLEASRALQQAAKNALDSVGRKFDRGAADILEVLSTQAAFSDANLERVRSMADWRSARLRLLAASGELGRWAVGLAKVSAGH